MTRTKSSRALLSVVLAVLMAAAFMPSLTYSSFAATAKKATKVTKLNHRGGTVYAKVGNKYTLKYSLSPSKLTSAAKKTAWKTSDKNVVKIIAVNGRHATIKAKQNGYANVKVYCKNNHKAQATWRIKVSKKATEIVINTDKVQKEYGLASKYNNVKVELTKADLLNGATATVNGKAYTLTEENVTIGDAINDTINKGNNNTEATSKTYPVTYSVTANGQTVTKTIKVKVCNQAPVLNTKDVKVAVNKQKETAGAANGLTDEKFIAQAVTSIDDYESFPADTTASNKTVAKWKSVDNKNTIEIAKIVDADGKTYSDISKVRVAEPTTYTVTLKATDFLGATTTKDVKLVVQENAAPTINTESIALTLDESAKTVDLANVSEQAFDQLTYNDDEDGQNVAVNGVEENKANYQKNLLKIIKFQDAKSNDLSYYDLVNLTPAQFKAKVAYVYVTNIVDKDGASAQAKRIPVSYEAGLNITGSSSTYTVVKTDKAIRVYVPYVSDTTYKKVLDVTDAQAILKATYNGKDLPLYTQADVDADTQALKDSTGNKDAKSTKVANLKVSDKSTAYNGTTTSGKFEADQRLNGETASVTFTVTAMNANGAEISKKQKVIFKVIDSAHQDAQIAYDKAQDADKTATAKDSGIYNDQGQKVSTSKVVIAKDATNASKLVVKVDGSAVSAKSSIQWVKKNDAKSTADNAVYENIASTDGTVESSTGAFTASASGTYAVYVDGIMSNSIAVTVA